MIGFALILSVINLIVRNPAGLLRALTFATLSLLLANPVLKEETRQPINDVAVLVVDQSESQNFENRTEQTANAAQDLSEKIRTIPNMELRTVDVGVRERSNSKLKNEGTALFRELNEALSDIAPSRLSGVILLTDGQIHDQADFENRLNIETPVHALLTGTPNGKDRRLVIEQRPRFGIVGEQAHITIRIEDSGYEDSEEPHRIARVEAAVLGQPPKVSFVRSGYDHTISVDIEHGGSNPVEITVQALSNEITLVNNSAIVELTGVRDRLRVLLVTGEPHVGERTWRNLLKADPAVDLVHFTILRPPDKQDRTPTNELSLIAFPTRQLFAQKLDEFDLIIFDRYRRRGVLPVIYLNNIARYVEQGGALLVAAGPAFANPNESLYRTPLAGVLPARPSSQVIERGFHPELSRAGARHPVTADLPGANDPFSAESNAQWGRWFRVIGADQLSGTTLMDDGQNSPLLILDHVGKGRIAQLLSDHSWLWTRGFEGGGPQAELLRRLAHWLMGEPELAEEDLRAKANGKKLEITRRTMASRAPTIKITSPSGKVSDLILQEENAGRYSAILEADELGLYRVTDGRLTAIAAIGALNTREFDDVRASADIVDPITDATGGATRWLTQQGLPEIRTVKANRVMAGRSWIGLKRNENYVVVDTHTITLIWPWLALLVTLGLAIFAWRREAN